MQLASAFVCACLWEKWRNIFTGDENMATDNHQSSKILRFLGDPRNLWIGYTLAIGLIAFCLIVSHTASKQAIASAYQDGEFINDSGRQRMLSQRILYLAQNVVRAPEYADVIELEKTIDAFKRSHDVLAAHAKGDPMLAPLYFEIDDLASLDEMSQMFVDDARWVVTATGPDAMIAFERAEATGADSLLNALDRAVVGFEHRARQHADQMAMIQNVSLIAVALVLLLVALGIFLPAHRSVVWSFNQIERQKERMRATASKLLKKNTDLKAARHQSQYNAEHDLLTGLPNRRRLEIELHKRLANAEDDDGLAIMHIDLDRFKQINDSLGHAAGDYILRYVADVLRALARPTDLVARMGGDEFIILASKDTSREALSTLCERMIATLREPVPYADNICRFGASIGIDVGIAREIKNQTDAERLLTNADIALYRSKETGRGRFTFFSPRLGQKFDRVRQLSNHIIEGVENAEFVPYYQLQYDAKTHAIVGAEALVRWHHPDDGVLFPGDFLDIAESMNVMAKIDEHILERVLVDMARWRADGHVLEKASVNLGSNRLLDANLVSKFAELSIPNGTISCEIVETVNMQEDSEIVLKNIAGLKKLGFSIEIDDFGTGNASITSMQTVRPNCVKIAKELIMPLATDPRQRAVIEATIALARSFDCRVIAEGVETLEIANILTDLGCDVLQGYLFGRAVPASEISKILRKAAPRALAAG